MKIFISIANSDYVTVILSALTFTSGQSSNNMPTQCIDLVILNDNILEYNETFMVQLASWSNKVVITAAGQQAEVVIMEDNADGKLHLITIILFLELHLASICTEMSACVKRLMAFICIILLYSGKLLQVLIDLASLV